MSFEIKKATRTGIIPLIGFYGRSSAGKTFSALLFARGFVGPAGRITVLDTENRRASLFSDVIPGGYNVIDLEPPFTPERYTEAMQVANKASDIIIIDSVSHLWSGEDGILEAQEAELQRMAGDDYKRREACKMAAWIKPKFRYNQWFQNVLRTPIPLIVCLRGQEKTHMDKDRNGKTVVVTDEFSTPIFDSRFIFDLICNLELVQVEGKPGCAIVRKHSHPDILKCLPEHGEQISEKHGTALAAWCHGKPKSQPAINPTTTPSAPEQNETGPLKKRLWTITKSIHQNSPEALEQYLWDEGIIMDTERMADLSVEQLERVLVKVETKLK